MDYVYPKLRLYCIERGYELNVIDLHWGLPDEHLNDHSLKELCLNELKSKYSGDCDDRTWSTDVKLRYCGAYHRVECYTQKRASVRCEGSLTFAE